MCVCLCEREEIYTYEREREREREREGDPRYGMDMREGKLESSMRLAPPSPSTSYV